MPYFETNSKRPRLDTFVFAFNSSREIREIIVIPRLLALAGATSDALDQIRSSYPGMENITVHTTDLARVKQQFPDLNWRGTKVTRIQL